MGLIFDLQKKMEQMVDLIKRLKNCVRWFKVVEEGYIKEKEKLQTDLESAEKKCVDTGEPLLICVLGIDGFKHCCMAFGSNSEEGSISRLLMIGMFEAYQVILLIFIVAKGFNI
jgi:hypothetical protein